MRNIVAIASALMMIAAFVPTAHAETASHDYFGGLARVAGVGLGFTCHENCLGDDNPTPGKSIGGARLLVSSPYTNVIVSTSDDIYGTNGGFSVCFWNPDGDNICDEEDYGTGTGCGTRALLGSPFAGDFVTTFIYSFVVTEDLEQCGASQGTITGDFF